MKILLAIDEDKLLIIDLDKNIEYIYKLEYVAYEDGTVSHKLTEEEMKRLMGKFKEIKKNE